jgi:hypothetical protein
MLEVQYEWNAKQKIYCESLPVLLLDLNVGPAVA